MKTTKTRSKLNVQIAEEASEWFVSVRSGDMDAEEHERFDVWLRTSPEHLRAYIDIAAIWEDGAFVDPNRTPSSEVLIACARAEANDNVVPIGTPSRPTEVLLPDVPPTHRAGRRTEPHTRVGRRAMLAASVLVAGVLAGGVAWWQLYRAQTYATEVGEQRVLNLPDGSTIELNSRSKVRVRYSEEARDVDLIRGQALFQVAKDAKRPFNVYSDRALVRAVGTQFDVYRKEDGTTVTVVEGRVAVLSTLGGRAAQASGSGPSATLSASQTGDADKHVFLSAGEQVTVTSEAMPQPRRANVDLATAWTQRKLVFHQSPLAEVAEEFNRYNTRLLVIEGDGLADFNVSGVFSSTNPASLLRFLREQPGIVVRETSTEIRIARKQ